jgi:hypothetical protein
MIYWLLFGLAFVVIMAVQFRPGGKYREMAKGNYHCTSCRAWLKWSDGHYASVCPRCGRTQQR